MNEVFEMAPAPARALWILGVVLALLVGIAALLGYVAGALLLSPDDPDALVAALQRLPGR